MAEAAEERSLLARWWAGGAKQQRIAWVGILFGLACTSGGNAPMRITAATLASASASGSGGTGDESGAEVTSDSASTFVATSDSTGFGTQSTGEGGPTGSSGGTSGSTGGEPGICESTLIDARCDTPGMWTGAGACNPYVPTSCGAGRKCGPFSFDTKGVASPATSCGSIPANPGAVGQPCTIESTPMVWTDSCAQGLFCEGDGESANGICVELCGCGPSDPTCPGGQLCQRNDMFPGYNVCRPGCDPLAPNCGANAGCYPIDAGAGAYEWMCFAAGTLSEGTACPGYNCDATTVCSRGACWQTCDLDAPATCTGQCMPYTRPPEDTMLLQPATACFDNVGVCVL